jgi:endosialidase-like protein
LLTVNGSADKPGGGSWGTFSDRRLKTLDGGFNAGLSQILKITPVRYRYKADNGMGIHDHEEHVGLVAQEVQKVIPEAVTENSKGYLLVNNDPIIWTMLNAIKEQQRLIQKQQSRMKVQQAEIARLSSQVKAVQASLKTNEPSGSEIRNVKAQVPMVQQ